jgi:hypothetical protein
MAVILILLGLTVTVAVGGAAFVGATGAVLVVVAALIITGAVTIVGNS